MDEDKGPERKFKPGGAYREQRGHSSPERTPSTSPEEMEHSPNANPVVFNISSDESGVGRSLNVSANLGSPDYKDEAEVSPKLSSEDSIEIFSDVSSKEESSDGTNKLTEASQETCMASSGSSANPMNPPEPGSQDTYVVSSSGSANGINPRVQDGRSSEETSDESVNAMNQNNQQQESPEVYVMSSEENDVVNGMNQIFEHAIVIDDSTYDIPEGGSILVDPPPHHWTNPNYFNNPQIKESSENPLPGSTSNEEDQSSVGQSQKSVILNESPTSVTESLGSLHIFSTPNKSDDSQPPVKISPEENENVEDLLPPDPMSQRREDSSKECLPSHSLNNPQEYSGFRSELIQTLQKCSQNQGNSAPSSAPSTSCQIVDLGWLDDPREPRPSTSTQSSDVPNPQMRFPSRHPGQRKVNEEVPGENRINLRKKLMVDIEMKKKVKFLLKKKDLSNVEEEVEESDQDETVNEVVYHSELDSDDSCKILEEETEKANLKTELDSAIFSSLPSYQPGGGFNTNNEEEEEEESDKELDDISKRAYTFTRMSGQNEDCKTEEIRSQPSPVLDFESRPLSKETVSPDVFSDESVDNICSGRFSSNSQFQISQDPQPSQKSIEEKRSAQQFKRILSSSDEEEDDTENQPAKYIRKRVSAPILPRKRARSLSDGEESGSESSDVGTRSPELKKSKTVTADLDKDEHHVKVFVAGIDSEDSERETPDVQMPFQLPSKRKRILSLSDDSGSESNDEGTRLPEAKKPKVISEYIEDQAVLSGEESSDEEENEEEDEDIIDFDDEELNIPESKLRDQVGQIHLKKTNEDDENLLKQLKNDFLDEGDLYNEGGSRSKNYSWSFPSTSQAQDIAKLSDESEVDDDDKTAVDENKLKWLKETDPLPEEPVGVPKDKKNLKLNIISKKQPVVKKDDVKRRKGKRGSFMKKGHDVIKDMDI